MFQNKMEEPKPEYLEQIMPKIGIFKKCSFSGFHISTKLGENLKLRDIMITFEKELEYPE
jgi:hypothetical protein